MLRKRSLHTTTKEWPPFTATRESPHAAMKIQGNQKKLKVKIIILKRIRDKYLLKTLIWQ